jgi:hypothetical protein
MASKTSLLFGDCIGHPAAIYGAIAINGGIENEQK